MLDQLSKVLRMQVQPLTKFRQLCDMEDGSDKGLHSGANFVWNVCFMIRPFNSEVQRADFWR